MSFVVMDENTLRKWGGAEMNEGEVKCPNCGAVAYWKIDGKSFECMECHNVWEMNENETMRKYAEAHGCENIPDDVPNFGARWNKPKAPVRPLPCVRDEHGEIKEQTVKELFAKIDEELNELKEVVYCRPHLHDIDDKKHIAEEAADTITAITTMLDALGIDAEMRDEAQRRVNEKNRSRGRI